MNGMVKMIENTRFAKYGKLFFLKAALFSLVMSVIPQYLLAQENIAARTIVSEDYREEVNYLVGSKDIKTRDTLEYYWHFANTIKKTQGGYDGEPLDGAYVKFYKNDNLKEKGYFNSGLKTGEWKKWSQDGKLLVHERWKRGLRTGTQLVYLHGSLIEKNHFRKGLKHGTSIKYNYGVPEEKVKYRNGLKRIKKQKETDPEVMPLKEKDHKDGEMKVKERNSKDSDNADKLRRKAAREKKKAERKLNSSTNKKSKSRSGVKKKIDKSNKSRDRK